jgi:hypothetical protein
MGPPRARRDWAPGAPATTNLEGDWALVVPDGTREEDLLQKSEDLHGIARWSYGERARILHLGPYADEPSTVERLHEFIDASGREVAGMHEEWCLSQPSAKVMKTEIVYPVRPKA